MYKMCLLIFASAFILLSCTVNDETGLVVISNFSSNERTVELSLTDRSSVFIGRGGKYDYWFYKPQQGNISVQGAELTLVANGYNEVSGKNSYNRDVNSCTFKQGYRYEIKLVNFFLQPGYEDYRGSNKLFVVVEPGIKVAGDASDSDYIHYPGE